MFTLIRLRGVMRVFFGGRGENTILHLAIKCNHLDILRYLLTWDESSIQINHKVHRIGSLWM